MKRLAFVLSLAAAACKSATTESADAAVETQPVDAVDPGMSDAAAHVRAALAENPPEIAKFVVHLHGPFSKDACDGNGLPDGKTPNAACLADLRAGLCASGLSVAFLTDHPTHMKSFPFQDLLYYDAAAGDKLIADTPGEPFANIIHCAKTPLLAAHDVQILVGFEGDHTMPVGLHHHLSNPDLYSVALSDSVPLADVQTVTAEVHARGGLMVLAHAEQELISAQRVHDAIDVVELYNIHANVMLSYIADPARLFEMDPWLAPPAEAAHPDLAIVPILNTIQEQPIALWHQVLQTQKVGTALGSDAHENVIFYQLCQGGMMDDLCEQKKATAPNAYKAFSKAGQITLADGVRYDNYTRMLRWYSSRARLPISQKMTFDRVQTALATGHTHHVWNVFGEPDQVNLVAVAKTDYGWKAADIGDSLALKPGMLLGIAWPHVVAEPWSPFTSTDADKAPREVRLWRVTPEGASVIATWDGQKATGGLVQDGPASTGDTVAWLPLPGAGRYHLEVRIQPTHLAAPLKAAKGFAQQWYRWVLTDVIEVTGT
jgi:hypothetical protein